MLGAAAGCAVFNTEGERLADVATEKDANSCCFSPDGAFLCYAVQEKVLAAPVKEGAWTVWKVSRPY